MLDTQITEFINQLVDTKSYSTNTILAYQSDLKQFIQVLESLPDWSLLDQAKLETALAFFYQNTYTPATTARKVAAIKRFLIFLHRQSYLTDDLSVWIVTPKVQHTAPILLSAELITLFLSSIEIAHEPVTRRNRILIYLLYAAGLQISPLVALTLDEASELTLPAKVQEYLQDYLENGRLRLLGNKQSNILFLNQRGTALTRQGAWLIIQNCAKKAGIQTHVTPRLLRQSFNAHHQGMWHNLA